METKKHAPPSTNSSARIREVPPSLALDLKFPDWSHGTDTDSQDNSRLALAHAAALLPSVLDQVLEGRNFLMNPNRFIL